MAIWIGDDIDFSAFMGQTETKQRVISASRFADAVIDYFHNPKRDRGVPVPWHKLGDKLKFRPSEVTAWSGINGHGKSLAIGQVSIGMLEHGHGMCIASLEMRPETTIARMCRQFFKCEIPDREMIQEFCDTVGTHLYVYDQMGTVTPEKIFAVIRYCAEELKLKHFVLDSLMKCGIAEDDLTGQKNFVDRLCAEAKDTGIHIHLVTHSRKGKDEKSPPGKMDVKGSGSITDQVDNVITWWRNKGKEEAEQRGEMQPHEPDALLICDKQRNGDWEGRARFWFDRVSLRFEEDQHGF